MGSLDETGNLKGFDSYEVRLGDELRGERATFGKSLLDVQRELRIKAAYIAAIENCDLAVFPNLGFVAGYVRSYARYLGLDAEEVYSRFCHESGFGGVNASLVAKKRTGSGRILVSGPVKAAPGDPLLKPLRAPAPELKPGLFERVSVSALGSLAVLVALVAGVGYGGFVVLQNIQRVNIAPVDQRPVTISEVAGLIAPGIGTEEVALSGMDRPDPEVSDTDLARLYQPRELEVPVVESRDGPIVDIDPSRGGVFGPGLAEAEADAIAAAVEAAMIADVAAEGAEPVVREEQGAPAVNIVARQPAWVRVYLDGGTVLFEKILETGETYTLPLDVEAPLLRAGNSGSVYVMLNDRIFGPVGDGTSVAKQVSLVPGDIEESYALLTEVPEVLQATLSALEVPETAD